MGDLNPLPTPPHHFPPTHSLICTTCDLSKVGKQHHIQLAVSYVSVRWKLMNNYIFSATLGWLQLIMEKVGWIEWLKVVVLKILYCMYLEFGLFLNLVTYNALISDGNASTFYHINNSKSLINYLGDRKLVTEKPFWFENLNLFVYKQLLNGINLYQCQQLFHYKVAILK